MKEHDQDSPPETLSQGLPSQPLNPKSAMMLVVLMGGVSLFADMTYEGARSITGPFLGMLGASAFTVGMVSGFGELIGSSLRLFSGFASDKTGRYWLFTILGYCLTLTAIPLIALAGSWEMASGLIVADRIGKALRSPAKDAILSHATHQMGRGWGFGIHEAMDQTGALLGPLVMAIVLMKTHDYRLGFGVLLIPALFTFCILFIAPRLYPRPQDLEIRMNVPKLEKFSKAYWLYLLAVILIAAGYADFPLIAYHFKAQKILPEAWIPLMYGVAMASDGLAALVLGKLFDQKGFTVLIYAGILSALFAPFVFWGGFWGAVVGMILWGIGMGAQESIVRAAVAEMVPENRRGAAYGIFNAGYGLFWFLGSGLMGFLYDHSLWGIVLFSMISQLAAIPIFMWICEIQKNKIQSL